MKGSSYYKVIENDIVIINTIPDIVQKELDVQDNKSDDQKLILRNVEFRKKTIKDDGILIVILSSVDMHIKKNNTLFIEGVFILERIKKIKLELDENKKKINNAFSKLTHNLTTLSTLNLQDIECFSPMGSTQDFNIRKLSDWKVFTDELDNEDRLQLAKMLIRVYKNTQHIQNDIIIYNRLFNNKEEEKDFSMHPLHRVVMRSLLSSVSPIMEQGVKLDIGDFEQSVYIDYTSIQVSLFYIMDNIIKYIKPNTILKVRFDADKKTKEKSVCFIMDSLYVTKKESTKIFEDGYSGEEAIKCKKNGSGIGLYISKKLIEENNGRIDFITDGTIKETIIGRNFGENRIKITFTK